MALPATLVWEVRPSTGTANAGGGFDPSVASPGTDFSQQDAVQFAYTDLVIDAVTNTNVTSVARPFSSVDVGNNIAITGGTGFTTGIYSIRSVAAAIATLDRAVGTVASTGGIGNIGGARSGFSNGTTPIQGILVAGNKAHVKRQTWAEAITYSTAGTAANPIIIEGYNLTRGDFPQGINRPTNTNATGTTFDMPSGSGSQIHKNIVASGAGLHGFHIREQNDYTFINCRATGCAGRGFFRGFNTPNIFLRACESDLNGSAGYENGGTGSATSDSLIGCNIHDNAGQGVLITHQGKSTLFLNIVEGNTGHNINISNASNGITAGLNTSNGAVGATANGFNFGSGAVLFFANNLVTNNGNFGVAGGGLVDIFVKNNNYFGNVAGARSNFPVGELDIAIDPQYQNVAANNFLPRNAVLSGAGSPGSFPGGTTIGQLTIGAAQLAVSDWTPAEREQIRNRLGIDGQASVPAATPTLSTVTTAQVKTQVVDALTVDTYTEIGQEAPAATQTLGKMLRFLYKGWRNRSTQTATEQRLFNDDNTTVGQKAATTDDGTTFDRGKIGSGP